MKLKVSLARAVFIWTYLTRLFEFSVNTCNNSVIVIVKNVYKCAIIDMTTY